MNVDLTPVEMAAIIRHLEAGNMADPVNAAIHGRLTATLQNFKPPDPEPAVVGRKWHQGPGIPR